MCCAVTEILGLQCMCKIVLNYLLLERCVIYVKHVKTSLRVLNCRTVLRYILMIIYSLAFKSSA